MPVLAPVLVPVLAPVLVPVLALPVLALALLQHWHWLGHVTADVFVCP